MKECGWGSVDWWAFHLSILCLHLFSYYNEAWPLKCEWLWAVCKCRNFNSVSAILTCSNRPSTSQAISHRARHSLQSRVSFHPLALLDSINCAALIIAWNSASLAILGPVFGETYHRAQAANSKEEFIKSKETASAAAAWGTSLVGSAIQSYGVGALLNATGTLSYKGAAYLGSLIFMASSAPSVSQLFRILIEFREWWLYCRDSKANDLLVRCPNLYWEAPNGYRCRRSRLACLWDSRSLAVPYG